MVMAGWTFFFGWTDGDLIYYVTIFAENLNSLSKMSVCQIPLLIRNTVFQKRRPRCSLDDQILKKQKNSVMLNLDNFVKVWNVS